MTSLSEQVDAYMEKYEAMVVEGERLAEKRKAIIGDHKFDESKYVTLTDYAPAKTAWKAAQADSVTIIQQQSAVMEQALVALELIVPFTVSARVHDAITSLKQALGR